MLTLLFGPRTAIGNMLPLLLLCDVIALRPYWQQWDLPNIRHLLPGGVLGSALGAFALQVINDAALAKLIGALAIVFSLLQFARAWYELDEPLEPRFWPGFLLGLATGFVSTLSHVGGLLTSMYLLMQKMDSRRFVATTTLFYFWINLLKMPVYWLVDMIDETTLFEVLPYAPLVIVGVIHEETRRVDSNPHFSPQRAQRTQREMRKRSVNRPPNTMCRPWSFAIRVNASPVHGLRFLCVLRALRGEKSRLSAA
ncbi:MAG: sulfite exporter TauE/SafE family protein [Planctomycetes bacterium]|nr:sulfite exporter TauE/SafE family protein [Planctomycetota bacterium]